MTDITCLVDGEMIDSSSAITKCKKCDTPYHALCYDYVGGCSVYGCTNTPHDLDTKIKQAKYTLAQREEKRITIDTLDTFLATCDTLKKTYGNGLENAALSDYVCDKLQIQDVQARDIFREYVIGCGQQPIPDKFFYRGMITGFFFPLAYGLFSSHGLLFFVPMFTFFGAQIGHLIDDYTKKNYQNHSENLKETCRKKLVDLVQQHSQNFPPEEIDYKKKVGFGVQGQISRGFEVMYAVEKGVLNTNVCQRIMVKNKIDSWAMSHFIVDNNLDDIVDAVYLNGQKVILRKEQGLAYDKNDFSSEEAEEIMADAQYMFDETLEMLHIKSKLREYNKPFNPFRR